MKRLFLFILFCRNLFAFDAVLYTSNGKFLIEIADTEYKRAYGFMNRVWIPKFMGMLFVFPESKPLNFWMRRTLNPLNIYFYNEEGKLVRAYRAEPCRTHVCPLYQSIERSRYVLEVHADSRFIPPFELRYLRLAK